MLPVNNVELGLVTQGTPRIVEGHEVELPIVERAPPLAAADIQKHGSREIDPALPQVHHQFVDARFLREGW